MKFIINCKLFKIHEIYIIKLFKIHAGILMKKKMANENKLSCLIWAVLMEDHDKHTYDASLVKKFKGKCKSSSSLAIRAHASLLGEDDTLQLFGFVFYFVLLFILLESN